MSVGFPPPSLPPPSIQTPNAPPPSPTIAAPVPFAPLPRQAFIPPTVTPSRSKPRLRIAPLLLAIIAGLAALAGIRYLPDYLASPPSASTPVTLPSVSVPSGSGYTVDTPIFRFVLPSEPTVEQFTEEEIGRPASGTSWVIDELDSGGSFLQVNAMNFADATNIDDLALEGIFDGLVGGMVRRTNGTLVSQEPLAVAEGNARRAIIDLGAAQMSVYLYGKGSWLVVIGGAADQPDPAALLAVVQTFTFK